jgi:hypothetical protein
MQPLIENVLVNGPQMTRKNLEIQTVNVLVRHIEREVSVNGMAPEQVAVVFYMRREAITALAHAGAPAVTAYTKAELEGAVAPTLLRVLANDTVPVCNLQEKIEAALGLCTMKYDNMPEYNPEVAHYLIGRMLGEYAEAFNLDYGNFADKVKKKLPKIAWKTESERLELGLKELAANAKKGPKGAQAEFLERSAAPPLKFMKDYFTPDERLASLARFVAQIKPKSGKVFKSLKAPEISFN